MAQNGIAVGDVVQIDPSHGEAFAACFLVVTELKSWGVMGYIRVPGEGGGDAFLRVPFDKVTRVGFAEWVSARHVEEGER
jgi:hypothetical protein